MKFEDLYHYNDFGVLSQLKNNPIDYKEEYLQNYKEIKNKTLEMSHLRMKFIYQNCESVNSLLDFGSGTGELLQVASETVGETYSYDIFDKTFDHSETLSEDQIYSKQFDVVTFYDSLEHTISPSSIIEKIKSRFIIISLPWCHIKTQGIPWFMSWKHRKYNEHLHHYDLNSLVSMMSFYGYDLLEVSNCEDKIRTPYDKTLPNILTCAFKKRSS